MRTLADTLDNDSYSRFPANERHEVARLLRWLDDGHFVLVGYQRCSVGDGDAEVDEPAVSACCVIGRTVFPQLTGSDQSVRADARPRCPATCATGRIPMCVVVRDDSGDEADRAPPASGCSPSRR